MPDTTPQFPNSGDRKFRLLLVHDYPPGVHAYELQRAFEALGHEVFTVGLAGNESLDGPLRAIDPSLRYDLLLSDLDTPANELVEAAGGADFLLYLEPGRAYLPRDIHACDIPTLGLLSEEAIYADWEVPLIPSFDLVLSAWHADQRRSRARGHDHVWQWYYAGAPSFMGNDHAPRPVDFTFVGNLHPVLQRERSRVLEQITALADEEYAVELRTMIFFDEYRQALNGAKTTYAGSVTRQINMRVLEAVAAGCLVIMPTPADPDDPVSHAFEPGREIVYAEHRRRGPRGRFDGTRATRTQGAKSPRRQSARWPSGGNTATPPSGSFERSCRVCRRTIANVGPSASSARARRPRPIA